MHRISLTLAALAFALGAPDVDAQGRGQGRGNMWDRMSRRDADGDGKISKEEFPNERMFQRFDSNGDGFITKDEVDAMRGRGGRGGGVSGRTLSRFDQNDDGKVTKDEWDKLFADGDKNGDGILDREELTAALSGGALRDPAPKVGATIPDVKAKTLATGKMVELAKQRRLTVLVFGSWT